MRKKILIVSHERSGTHFLINTIAQSFGYLPNQIDLDRSQNVNFRNLKMARNWLNQFQGRFVANIFKAHHAYPILSPLLPHLSEEFHVFYVRRDGRDVMTSFWTYLNRLAPGWGPQTRTVGEFMRTTAKGGITQYQADQIEMTMLQRWVEHVDGWTRFRPPVHYVAYEKLHGQYTDTVDRIAGILGQPAVSKDRPTLESPSSLPWRGEVGTWKEFLSESDCEYFARETKRIRNSPHKSFA